MISDFINIDRSSDKPMYIQIYREIKNAIENGNIKEDEKIPSVRKLCYDLNVSKTTIENAYSLLCAEGYIINIPKKGYYIEKGLYINKSSAKKNEENKNVKLYKYDFSGKGIDKNCSNIKEWKKYVKDILNKEYLLNTYSESQGEESLRKAISKYSFTTRGVNCDSKNIIIGSGSQTLIYILCGIIGLDKKVAIEKNTFPQAEQVFKDFNYNINYTKNDKKGITTKSLDQIKPDILVINPNYNSDNGSTTPIARKIEIINWAKKNDCLIIEDDYNGELRYKTHAQSCIQSYSPENVVYLGSFSKIITPGMRLGYIIAHKEIISLVETAKQAADLHSNIFGQYLISDYLQNNDLDKHIEKIKALYKAQSSAMVNAMKKYFPKDIKFTIPKGGMFTWVTLNEGQSSLELFNKAIAKNVAFVPGDPFYVNEHNVNTLRLNYTNATQERIEEGIKRLADTIKEN